MDKVKFQANVPELVTLRHGSGKIVDGRFGEQVYYSLADGRCMYLDLGVAQKINLLEVQPGESVNICKRGGGIWDIWLSPETEKMRSAKDQGASIEQRLRQSVGEACERRYDTLKVPALQAPTPINAGASVSAPAPAAPCSTATTEPLSNTANRTNPLVDEANDLVDALAAVMDRSLKLYEGRIKPEEIRSCVLTVYISKSKGAKSYAA